MHSAPEATHHRAVLKWRKGHLFFTHRHLLLPMCLEHGMYPSPTSNPLSPLTVRAVGHGMGSRWGPVSNAASQAPPQAS